MTDRDSQTHRWSEADVDSLLTEFFRAEMPAELRRIPPVASAVAPIARRRGRFSAGFKGLAAAACALVLAVVALSPGGRNLVSPKKNSSSTKPEEDTSVEAKKAASTEPIIADQQPMPLPPEAFLKLLPPEWRNSADRATVPTFSGDDDPLSLRDLLRIEVFEPRDGSRPPKRAPKKRPRLPEER